MGLLVSSVAALLLAADSGSAVVVSRRANVSAVWGFWDVGSTVWVAGDDGAVLRRICGTR